MREAQAARVLLQEESGSDTSRSAVENCRNACFCSLIYFRARDRLFSGAEGELNGAGCDPGGSSLPEAPADTLCMHLFTACK